MCEVIKFFLLTAIVMDPERSEANGLILLWGTDHILCYICDGELNRL